MKPQIITLDKIGSSQLGYITIAEAQKNIPFDIKGFIGPIIHRKMLCVEGMRIKFWSK